MNETERISGDKTFIFDLGWKWFKYHAKQRLDVFKFFLTIYSAISVGGGILYDKGFFRLTATLGIIGLIICFMFWRLDIRSRRLTELGEALLDEAFRREGLPTGLNPILRAQERWRRGIRFKTAFALTYIVASITAFAMLLLSLSESQVANYLEVLVTYLRTYF